MWTNNIPENWYIKFFYGLNSFRVIRNLKWVSFFLGHPVAYPLKISLSSDKFNVFKTSSIEDRRHLISETIGVSRISVVFICFKLTK